MEALQAHLIFSWDVDTWKYESYNTDILIKLKEADVKWL
ncbi:hypothetical protein HMPREF9412_3358 [Paenibacillus sp. HGF5]|nr:hypothetical protein HMPREF9412_3358 [Paenibacillus sp. HGF5]